MGALIIPGGYYLLGLTKYHMLYIMVPVTLFVIFMDISRLRHWPFWEVFAKRIIGSIIRQHELDGDFTGATYILISTCLTVALFSKPIAIAALAFIIVGDSFAAIIGRKFGRHRFFNNKTIEGSLACLAGTVIVAIIAPDLVLPVALVGACIATLAEAFPFGTDDNVTVPILSGLIMTLFEKVYFFMR